MTQKKKTTKIKALPSAAKQEEQVQEGKQIKLEDLKIGYVVGVEENGNFVFEIFGKSKGLVELLGVHEHAGFKVKSIYEASQVMGDRLIHEVGKAVAIVNQKLDVIANKLEQFTVVEEDTEEVDQTKGKTE